MAKELYEGQMQKGTIPLDLYKKTANKLVEGLYSGLGGSPFGYGSPEDKLKPWLERNIYKFSCAKSLAELEELRGMMTDADGKKVPFKQFRDAATAKGYQFNKRHLEVEYDNAEQSAVMARKWEELSTTNDYLEYSTTGDEKVCPTCAPLDGTTLPVGSPLWGRIWPPLHFLCKCTVIPGIGSKASKSHEVHNTVEELVGQKKISPMFDNNVGQSRAIYEDGHPYFEKTKFNSSRTQLDAVANYGLPAHEQIYADPSKLPVRVELGSKDELNAWWADQPKHTGTEDILLRDKLGNNVLVPQKTKVDHEYAANLPDVISEPDEMWTGKKNGELTHYYVKYYGDAAYVAIVDGVDSGLSTEAFYPVNASQLKQLRQGILLFTK